MHKLKNILLWSLLGVYLILVLGFISDRHTKIICNKIDIRISDEDYNKFLQKDDVTRALERYKMKYIGRPIDSINTFIAEQIIDRNPAVESASAYTTIDGRLNILVRQRRPILRVTNKKLQSYYIDETGQLIPLMKEYAAFTLIANGNIEEPFDPTTPRKIFPFKKDSILRPNIIYDLYHVAKYIDDNDFWRSQIEQIYVDSHSEMELVPRVGSQIIIFGKANDLENKFRKLKSMYRAFNEIGWNQYKTINLKFKDQVVCTKR
jgi:cell division protein FtsQ